MSTDNDRPPAEQSREHEHERPGGPESPHNLLAIHDPSKHGAARGRQAAGRGHGVTVQWVRPTELAVRIAAKSAAGAVAAHAATHRQVREHVRARLAPLSAFGRHADVGPAVAGRSVVGR